MTPFSLFAASLAFFHTSEFALAYAYQEHVGWHSARTAQRADSSRTSDSLPRAGFLFSAPYVAAMSFACLEHALELRFAPWLKVSA